MTWWNGRSSKDFFTQSKMTFLKLVGRAICFQYKTWILRNSSRQFLEKLWTPENGGNHVDRCLISKEIVIVRGEGESSEHGTISSSSEIACPNMSTERRPRMHKPRSASADRILDTDSARDTRARQGAILLSNLLKTSLYLPGRRGAARRVRAPGGLVTPSVVTQGPGHPGDRRGGDTGGGRCQEASHSPTWATRLWVCTGECSIGQMSPTLSTNYNIMGIW